MCMSDFACVYICTPCACLVPREARLGHQIPGHWSYKQLWAVMQALANELIFCKSSPRCQPLSQLASSWDVLLPVRTTLVFKLCVRCSCVRRDTHEYGYPGRLTQWIGVPAASHMQLRATQHGCWVPHWCSTKAASTLKCGDISRAPEEPSTASHQIWTLYIMKLSQRKKEKEQNRLLTLTFSSLIPVKRLTDELSVSPFGLHSVTISMTLSRATLIRPNTPSLFLWAESQLGCLRQVFRTVEGFSLIITRIVVHENLTENMPC